MVSHTLGTNGRIKENGCSKDLRRLIMRLAKGKRQGKKEVWIRKRERERRKGREMCISLLLFCCDSNF